MRFAEASLIRAVSWTMALLVAPTAWADESGAGGSAPRPPAVAPEAHDGGTKPDSPDPSPDTGTGGSASGGSAAAPTPPASPARPAAHKDAPSAAAAAPLPERAAMKAVAPAASQAETLPAGAHDTSMSVGTVEVVVTGKRSRTLALPGSVDVIGEEQTSKEVTTNALDLMRRIPGFAYQDYGNGGVPNGFMLRGFSSNHGADTLVVIDGVPINEHSWYGQDDGAPDLNQLTAEEIERIEVIKGPLDARYGNWGRSGIIQIHTRQNGNFWKGNLSLGSYGSRKAHASFGTEHFDGRFNQVYSVESFESDGWRRNSQQQRQNAYGKWFYRPMKDVRLGLMTHFYRANWSTGSYIAEDQWRQDPRQAFSGSANDGGYKSLGEVALHADAKLFGRFPVKSILWHRASTASRYADWTNEGNGQSESHGNEKVSGGVISLDTDWTLTGNQTLRVDGGIDYRHFDTKGTNWNTQARVRQLLTEDHRYIFQNGGIYLKASYEISKLVRFSAGVREDLFWGNDKDRQAGTQSSMKVYSVPTYKSGVVVNVLENISLYGNAGTTFRLPNQAAKYQHPAPTVSTLFFWETGLKATFFDALALRYAYFQSSERLTRLDQGQYLDDGKARRAGHEVELKAGPWNRVELFTALTIHDGHYLGGANDGNTVPTVPRYIWKLGLQAETPWGTGGRVNFNDVGRYYTDPENTHSYGGYRVVDLGLYQLIAKDWSVALDAKNLLNATYSEFVGYWSNSNQYMPSNPLTVFASLRFSKD